MVLDEDFIDIEMEEHAAMLQNRALIQKNGISKRKEQLKNWENSEMNRLCPRRQPLHRSKVKFQDHDIFLSACQSGDEEEVEGLLQRGFDINVSTIDGVTALHQAVIDGKEEIVRFLVEHGADINAQDNEGWTPLHAAVCCGSKLPIAKYLVEHGSDLTRVNSDRELPVDLAESDEMRTYLENEMRKIGVDEQKAREHEFDIMLEDCNRWIQMGKYVDQPHPRTGATALHVAASKGYNKLIGMLIRAGADINAQDFEGWTPLHAAAHWGERDACRILMENGASLDALTHTMHSVLAVADKSIEEYLYGLKEKFNEIRSGALQQHHQLQQIIAPSNGPNAVLQDASNLAAVIKDGSSAVDQATLDGIPVSSIVGTHSGLHGVEKLQSGAIRRISSSEKLAIKRKDMESDENLVVNGMKARLSPPTMQTTTEAQPVPIECQSLLKREEMMNGVGGGLRMNVNNNKKEQQTQGDNNKKNGTSSAATMAPLVSAEEEMDDEEEYEEEDEEEVEDESEWTEVTATPSLSCSAPAPSSTTVDRTKSAAVISDGGKNDQQSEPRRTSTTINSQQQQQMTVLATQTPSKDSYSAKKEISSSTGREEAKTIVDVLANGGIKTKSANSATSSLASLSVSKTGDKSTKSSGTTASLTSSTKEDSASGSGSGSNNTTREGSHSSDHSRSSPASSYSSDRSNTGSGVSSIHTTSRSVTPKDRSASSSLYSSDQNIQYTVRVAQPSSHSHSSAAFTSSTTTNHSNKAASSHNQNHKSAVLRAAEETVKRLRQQLPNVQTSSAVGPDRGKSQSVDYGKPAPPLEPPLKSPPASAPLVQSARLFWNSIGNQSPPHPSTPQSSYPPTPHPTHQNHPIGSTQLHQQQFHRSRQRFAASGANHSSQPQHSLEDNTSSSYSSSPSVVSPFALVAGENQKPIFRRGESLKAGLGGGMSFTTPAAPSSRRHQQAQERSKLTVAATTSTNNSTDVLSIKLPPSTSVSKQDEFLFGSSANAEPKMMTTAGNISRRNNPTIGSSLNSSKTSGAAIACVPSQTTSESQSCCSSLTASPSPSPIVVHSPFVTVRKQSWQQQSTPPTQPTSQKESESERKAKSKLKRSTRRSTQGVTLEHLGDTTGRLNSQHNLQNHHQLGQQDRIQQANAKFNRMMEQQKPSSCAQTDQLRPGSPGCSSASSSSAYITAPSTRQHAKEMAGNDNNTAMATPISPTGTSTMPIANFSSTALLIDELNKYKQLYEKERDENERLRLQVQELSAEARAKASNQLRGVGWRPGATLIQRTELPSGLSYSTVTRPTNDRTGSPPETVTALYANGSDDRHSTFEKRINELESEVERMHELRSMNDQLKKENESLLRVLAKSGRNNYNAAANIALTNIRKPNGSDPMARI